MFLFRHALLLIPNSFLGIVSLWYNRSIEPQTIVLLGEPKFNQHICRAICRGLFPTNHMTPEGKTLKEAYQWEARAVEKPLPSDVEV
jgi:hypothetical protein